MSASVVTLPFSEPAVAEVRLQRLTLRNFKGQKDLSIEAAGRSLNVYGQNGAGKTTISDALNYLLFGKDSLGRSDFDIKTREDGETLHKVDHEVEGVFTVQGRKMMFRRLYKEVYTRQRGAASESFSGHTTDYFVNDVPVQKSEYDHHILAICEEKRFRLLTDPYFFNNEKALPWQERRKLLLDIVGDLSDEGVIAASAELTELPLLLEGHTIDEHRKIVDARRKRVNEERDGIPKRIDEVQRSIVQVQIKPEAAEKELTAKREKRSAKQDELARITGGGEITQKRKAVAEIDLAILEAKNVAGAKASEDVGAARKALGKAQVAQEGIESKKRRLESEHADAMRLRTKLDLEIQDLRAVYKKIAAGVFTPAPAAGVCPACNQALPEEEVIAATRKAQEQFNLLRSTKLERNQTEGKAVAARLGDARNLVDARAQDIEAVADELAEAAETVQAAKTHLNLILSQTPDEAAPDPEAAKLEERRNGILAEIERLKASTDGAAADVRGDIAKIDTEIHALEDSLAQARQNETAKTRKAELEADEKRLAAQHEELERQRWMLEEFVRVKVDLLESRINRKFETVRFRLFETQVNQGIKECCICTSIDGRPYDTALSTGERIVAGLEIIKTLQEHFNFYPFVVVDGAESVTLPIPNLGQVLRLVVSAADTTLRIEPQKETV